MNSENSSTLPKQSFQTQKKSLAKKDHSLPAKKSLVQSKPINIRYLEPSPEIGGGKARNNNQILPKKNVKLESLPYDPSVNLAPIEPEILNLRNEASQKTQVPKKVKNLEKIDPTMLSDAAKNNKFIQFPLHGTSVMQPKKP